MEDKKGNMAPGQQNYPSNEDPQGNPNRKTGSEIIKGARQEDQLDKMKENAPEDGTNNTIGAEPKAYQYHRKTENENQ
ncbi:hypothetical protein FPZ43_00125 [Mucilaginibacter pallidiroseus]|uniref:Uncharacterized protein n=1 Tax=Mucilaginibacter pallidiroseus TaxID=2599295 RepID=A0A563UHT7_9SPHI|nr:hypothetical protein [Mucilaginibacter pallidiroseus]TWR30925.1 hypothetical protein FPZ43_00125 [Mucilaginibacter pallidiroseus]